MASADEVKRLAVLARIKVDEAQLARFAKEFDGILAYVGQLESLDVSLAPEEKPALRNVFRNDGEPTPAATNTETLAAQFPEREGNYLKVKQIISHD